MGIKVTRNKPNQTLHLNQEAYLKKILQETQMISESSKPTRMPINNKSCIHPADPEDKQTDQKPYQKKMRLVMYTAINTRPNIAFTIGKLSQYVVDPARHHKQTIKYLMRYLRSTIKHHLTYKTSGSNQIIGYADGDYTKDRQDCKLIMGIIFLLNGGPILWSNRKQRSVSTSTTEVEYMTVSSETKQTLWLSQLLRDMGFSECVKSFPWIIQLFDDNTGSLDLIKNPYLHKRSKHINMAHHFI